MRLQNLSDKQLKESVLGIIGKYLDLTQYRVFVFGSRASASGGSDRSDIDIGIEGKEIPALIMGKIKAEFAELPIIYKFDIVDFANVSADFKKIAYLNTYNLSNDKI